MTRSKHVTTAGRAGRRVGLLGGSFDPVHHAHVALADAALDHLHLDALRWIPAGAPWQRPPLGASPADRAAMVALAIAGRDGMTVDPIEVNRAGPSYTSDTIDAMVGEDVQLVLILGGDQLANFCTWHRWQDIATHAELAIAARDGLLPDTPEPLAQWLSAQGRRLSDLPMPAMPVSASLVRRRLAQGEPVDDLVPAAVVQYIRDHRLYGSP